MPFDQSWHGRRSRSAERTTETVTGRRIDLFLGGDLGLWALEEVSPTDILQVFSLDPAILEAAKEKGIKTVTGDANEAETDTAETGLSVHFPVIFRQSFLAAYRVLYNLHPAYLPWGRGYYPIFWALLEDTPAGATLHEITVGVDEGPLVAQKRVEQRPSDTGEDLFHRVREAEKHLFREYWPRILRGERLPSRPQEGRGTYHTKREFLELKRQARWGEMRGEDLVRLIRALTFRGYTGLEITLGGEPFHVRLERVKGE